MNADVRVVPFLRVRMMSLLAAMSLAVACRLPTLSAEDLRLVQLTDIHASREDHNPQPRFPGDPLVNDLVHSLDILRAAVERINTELRPELVVITGDFVDRGDDLESLREVKTCLDRLTCPYYPVIGDHEQKATYQQVFPQRLDYAFDHRGWHLVDPRLQQRATVRGKPAMAGERPFGEPRPTDDCDASPPLARQPVVHGVGQERLWRSAGVGKRVRRPWTFCGGIPTCRWCSPDIPTCPTNSKPSIFLS